MYFSMDINMSGKEVNEYYKKRFQIEFCFCFCFRDAKK